MKGQYVLPLEDGDPRAEQSKIMQSPLLAAGADPHVTLAAAVLNQAINDLTSTGWTRTTIEREAHSRGFVSIRADVEEYLRGSWFSATAWGLHTTPRLLRRMIYEYARGNA